MGLANFPELTICSDLEVGYGTRKGIVSAVAVATPPQTPPRIAVQPNHNRGEAHCQDHQLLYSWAHSCIAAFLAPIAEQNPIT